MILLKYKSYRFYFVIHWIKNISFLPFMFTHRDRLIRFKFWYILKEKLETDSLVKLNCKWRTLEGLCIQFGQLCRKKVSDWIASGKNESASYLIKIWEMGAHIKTFRGLPFESVRDQSPSRCENQSFDLWNSPWSTQQLSFHSSCPKCDSWRRKIWHKLLR